MIIVCDVSDGVVSRHVPTVYAFDYILYIVSY